MLEELNDEFSDFDNRSFEDGNFFDDDYWIKYETEMRCVRNTQTQKRSKVFLNSKNIKSKMIDILIWQST